MKNGQPRTATNQDILADFEWQDDTKKSALANRAAKRKTEGLEKL